MHDMTLGVHRRFGYLSADVGGFLVVSYMYDQLAVLRCTVAFALHACMLCNSYCYLLCPHALLHPCCV